MTIKFFKKHFLRLLDFTYDEINQLLNLAAKLKRQKITGREIKYLSGKNIVLIFEKDSTRTRCSFEVAAFDQGAHVTYLGLSGNQIGHKESIKDTARVLGRIYDGIQYRGHSQKILKMLANYAGIPVWNGLTSEFHPTQLIADLLTIQESYPEKEFNKIKLAYIGDIRNNIGNTLLEVAAITGMDIRLVGPKDFWPNKELLNVCQKLSQLNGGKITITEDISIGIKEVEFIYTDVWVSMGEDPSIWNQKIKKLRSYQVNMDMLRRTNNPYVKFLHCLPALHDNNTILGKQIGEKYNLLNGIEVTNEVFESQHSLVFNQAENRLHTIKALMIATLLRI